MNRRRPPETAASADPFREEFVGRAVRWIGTASMTAAVVSRNLFPAEDATEGSGTYFIPLAFLTGFCLVAERLLGWTSAPLRWPVLSWAFFLVAWFIATTQAEYRYPADNMNWEWGAVAIVALYGLHWGVTAGPAAWGGVVLTICLMQSLLAGYESFVTLPNLRAQYERNDPAFTQSMRNIGVEKGSKLEESFRNRLFSSEPLGTTGHPNSLAGILLFGLPLALVLVEQNRSRSSASWWGTIGAAVVLIVLVTALLLTKSRSAWIGAVVAFALVVALRPDRSSNRGQFTPWLALGGALAGLVMALIAAGVLDLEILTQALQSFSYRWEWWQASLPVFLRSPWWGVGPGNFRNHYLEFKLPYSSEEIADPHQFVVELAVTGGLFAVVGYIALILFHFRQARKHEASAIAPSAFTLKPAHWFGAVVALLLVLLLDVGLLPWIAQPENHPAFPVLILSGLVVSMMGHLGATWSESAVRRAILAGAVALHVHWLMAGGVAFPSLMMLLWVSLGIAASTQKQEARPSFTLHAMAGLGLAGASVFYLFAVFSPRVERDLVLEQCRRIEDRLFEVWSPLNGEVRPELWKRIEPEISRWADLSRKAAVLVPEDRSGWDRLAVAETTHMRLLAQIRSPSEESAYRRAVKAWDEVIRLDPRKSLSYLKRGELYREAAASRLDAEGYVLAEKDIAHAVRLYPNSALRRWQWAEILSELNRSAEASREFHKALELDRTPHLDKRLTETQRDWANAYLKNHPVP